MSNANPSLPRPPSYYFQPVKVEPEPTPPPTERPDFFEPLAKRFMKQTTPTTPTTPTIPRPSTPPPTERPDFFEPLAKRFMKQTIPTTPRPSTPPPPPTPTMASRQSSQFTQTPMRERWLLDPMP